MEARPLEDRSDRMFGRERDLQALQERVRFNGLTAVVGEPQMGKSWLLTELARRLASEHQPNHFVGFVRYAEEADLLRRAVRDLYDRWLSDARLMQQAQMIWEQQKENLLAGIAGTVGKIFSAVFDDVAKPVTVAVDEGIKRLIAANETLTSGGLKLPTLHYEQARDLVDAVYRISGRPVALFLDQFEEALDPGLEVKRLRAFLRDAGDWPACHIFVALQPKEHAIGPITELTRAFQGPARAHRLGPLDLDDTAARDGLLSFLNWRVPAVRGLPEEQILASIDGYPGVIYQWTSDYQREAMRSVEDLERVAADAHAYRFGELDTLLPALQGEARRLAARLALLPLAADPEAWDEIKPQVCDGLNPEMLDDLRLNRVLESADPPSFGHAKRWEAALTWFVKNRKNTIKPEAEALILAFASRVRDASANASAPTMALIVIGTTSGGRDLPDLHRAVCEAAMTLFRLPGDAHAILRGAQTARTEARAAPLIAMSLFNTLIDAKAESDFRLRDTLLAEMRALAQAHSKDASVRNMLTRVLFNTLIDAKGEGDLGRRNALLAELRALAAEYPKDAGVRENLAMGLLNTLNHAKEEDDLDRRDALLQELRDLPHGKDARVLESLAKGVFNTLNHAKAEGNLQRRDALLQELRDLAKAHGKDATVREPLAAGLVSTLNHAKEEDDLGRRDALLDELRALARAHGEDAAVREHFGNGLFHTLYHAKAENDMARRDALLGELRALARAHVEDAALLQHFANGLFNELYHAKAEDDLGRRDALLDELRALAEAHPDDEPVQKLWRAASGED